MAAKKYLVHVPVEQYGFISCEIEGEAEEAVTEYREIARANRPASGLTTKEWNATLDGYVKDMTMTAELYDRMSDTQKLLIQELKKSLKRINK